MNATPRLTARRHGTLAKLIASTHWFEQVKIDTGIDRDRDPDHPMKNRGRKSVKNRVRKSMADGESVKKITRNSMAVADGESVKNRGRKSVRKSMSMRKSMADGESESESETECDNIQKVRHKTGGVQSWRQLVRMCNVLFTVKGCGIKGVASSVNRYTSTEILMFFERFRLTPGNHPLPEWEVLTKTNIYATVSSIMSFISNTYVCKKSASRILVRPNGGTYVFLDDVARAWGLPNHQKMYDFFI